MDYQTLRSEALSHGETNDCAVKAVAIATGTPYSIALDTLAAHGRKRRERTHFNITKAATESLGFELTRVYTKEATVRTVACELGQGSYFVRVRAHILCIKDGVVEDWSDNRLIRVREVWRVTKVGEVVPEAEPVRISFRVPVAKSGTVKERVWAAADVAWVAAGKPTDKKEVLALRKVLMNELELLGIKRTTASVELGNWQAVKIVQK